MTKLLCKKTVRFSAADFDLVFIKDKYYEYQVNNTNDIIYTHLVHGENGHYRGYHIDVEYFNNDSYLYNTFYTIDELREMQLNKII